MKKITVAVIASSIFLVTVWFTVRHALNSSPGYSQAKLNASFTSYVHQVRGLKRLQLAEVNAIEILERTSEHSLFWDMVKLPDVVVQARIPVRYLYYVDLEDPFDIRIVGEEVQVSAPPLRGTAPAADISGMTYEVKKGSMLRNSHAAIEELRKTITPFLNESSATNRILVAEEARRQLEEIVRAWIITSPDVPSELKVRVTFADKDLSGSP